MALTDFCSISLPYCLQRESDGGYVTLNREYKPIGFNASDFTKYGDFPISTQYKGITEKFAVGLSYNSSTDLDTIFLYDDGTSPLLGALEMTAYVERLSKLAKLKVKTSK